MVPIEHGHAPRRADRPSELVSEEWAKELELHEPDLLAGAAAGLDDTAQRAHRGARGDEHRVGVGGVLRLEGAARPPAEDARELGAGLLEHLGRPCHRRLDLLAVPLRLAGAHHLSIGARAVAPRPQSQVERRQVGVYELLRRQVDHHAGVRKQKAVLGHHHGEQHARVLGDAKGEHDGIHEVLVRVAIELQPGRVAQGEAVAVVGPDVPRRTDRAIGHDHDDGQARQSGGEDVLRHIEESVGRAGGEGARAGE